MKHTVLSAENVGKDTAANAGRASANPMQLLKDQAAQLQRSSVTQLAGGPEEELPVQGKFAAQLAAAPEEELPVQGKFVAQLAAGPEEELPVQGKFTTQLATGPEEELPMQRKAENNTGLPDQLKSGVENLSGYAMDDVKVHYNSPQPAQLNALAYAQGSDIHVGPGQEQHLPHETWHVVQQMQGRVQPTLETNGVPVNDDAGLEREADVMGDKATNL